MPSDDDSWTLVGARKPGPKRSVLYIGNLNAECTEEKLMAFVEGRTKTIGNAAPKVFNAKIYTTNSESGCLSARLTVAESDRALLQARNFWPRPIYARPWNFHLASSKEGDSKDTSVVKVLKTSTCKDHDDKGWRSPTTTQVRVGCRVRSRSCLKCPTTKVHQIQLILQHSMLDQYKTKYMK